ncbi:MAG: 3-hydroxybutyryl-CoA dehydrogenase [Deltaproteobacteria bacterium]|nr:3-hydroxybutyryl-CoA dehydrogenase [Deltaproteobacteria bacterium]
MKKIGIIGCGTMGAGIVQVCAQSRYDVYVREIDQAILKKGLESIGAFLSRSVEKGRISEADKEAALSRIHVASDMKELADCDLVIEAIVENLEVKKALFKELDELCKEETILATNTSSLSIMDIAKPIKRQERVLGIHFFNPVPVMKLVEIVRSIVTSDEVVEQSKEFAASLGKTAITAKDSPGFIVNYLQYPFRLNAIRMLERGIASRDDIDAAAKLGLGHPIGPLELQDLVGLDITYAAVGSIYEATKDPNFAPPVLMQQMISAGRLGRKTGRGFYRYKNGEKAPD